MLSPLMYYINIPRNRTHDLGIANTPILYAFNKVLHKMLDLDPQMKMSSNARCWISVSRRFANTCWSKQLKRWTWPQVTGPARNPCAAKPRYIICPPASCGFKWLLSIVSVSVCSREREREKWNPTGFGNNRSGEWPCLFQRAEWCSTSDDELNTRSWSDPCDGSRNWRNHPIAPTQRGRLKRTETPQQSALSVILAASKTL